MSYWCYLLDKNGEPVRLKEPHREGAVVNLEGSTQAEMNVTWNYSARYAEHNFSITGLNGKTAKDVIGELNRVISELGTDKHPDYWKATDGNARKALSILLSWAEEHPGAVFEIH